MALYQIISFYIFSPAFVIYICHRIPFLNKIGAVIICYGAGITLGNSGILPEGIFEYQEITGEVSVALALPLLLFSLDVKRWVKLAGKALLSMALATFSVVIIAFAGFLFFREVLPESWQLVGMAIGVYTGGTPNLAAIKAALHIDSTTFIMFHTYDTFFTAIYILFFITVAQRFFNLFLPKFRSRNKVQGNGDAVVAHHSEGIDSYVGIFKRRTMIGLTSALLLAAVAVAVSLGISMLVPESFSASVAVVAITTFGIGLSFVTAVRKIEKTFQLGMYSILIFCLVVGSMANVSQLVNINYPALFYVMLSIFGSLLLHAVLCRFLRIDTDTFLITSTSAICSPPFVPVVAGVLKNREVLLSGLTTGIIGYAIGNYLGISVAYLVSKLF